MKKTTKTQTPAQQLKAAIKAAGIPTRQISVTTSYPGYETVIHVTVKDVAIDLDAVKQIARRFESVDYDERCQEILAGGNTFVRVRYSSDVEREAVQALEPLAADTIKQIRKQISHITTTHPGKCERFTVQAPNGTEIKILVVNGSPDWIAYVGDSYSIAAPHRFIYPDAYTPEYFPAALAQVLFDLGARWVDLIPDPEPTPEPDNNFYYIVNAKAQSFSGYAVELTAPDYTTAAAYAEGAAESAIEQGDPAPVYYVVTRSAILARVDNKGIHAPKDKPQRTPSKVLTALDAYDLHKAS